MPSPVFGTRCFLPSACPVLTPEATPGGHRSFLGLKLGINRLADISTMSRESVPKNVSQVHTESTGSVPETLTNKVTYLYKVRGNHS